jgi:pimeloyl-ACP methyl ester carboxylesterase
MTTAERHVDVGPRRLQGMLAIPPEARGLVVFAHGSGSSRLSPRNHQVARALNDARFGTLLFDLLHDDEAQDRARVFDIDLLAGRLIEAVHWLDHEAYLRHRPLGLFGASTGAAAALVAAAHLGARVAAVVARGGRVDLAGHVVERLHVPTLLIVGAADPDVLALNEVALGRLRGPKAIEVVPGATHLFEEPGTLEAMTTHAVVWFERHLTPPAPR